MIEDDDLWRLKMGRVSEWDARIAENLFRFRKRRFEALSARGLAWRTRHVDSGWRFNSGPQVMVKAAGSRKSRAGVRACVRYVARLRPNDGEPARAYDEFGRELVPEAVLKAVDGWRLDSDADNRSATATTTDSEALGERRRLRNIQAWHFVFSIVAERNEDARESLVRAAAATIDAIFTRSGHRVIWTLHTDRPGRPHVHAVVKAVSELGGRLRCDIHGDLFDTLRSEFAAALSMTGLRFQAARREDRSELRDRIVTGREPLRPGGSKGRGDGDLLRRAPVWFAQFGPDYVERLRHAGEESLPQHRRWWHWFSAAPYPRRHIPPSLADAHTAFVAIYHDPYRALTAWQWLAIEGAQWCPNGEAAFQPCPEVGPLVLGGKRLVGMRVEM